jgi:branched-chain amino acid transport system substrate-binding protein
MVSAPQRGGCGALGERQNRNGREDMKKLLALIGVIVVFATSEQVLAQSKTVKIGFVATFSGPLAVIGNDMRNSFNLALDRLNHQMGGLPVEVIYEDDQQKPEIGMQKTKELIESDHVDFLTGYIFSNVLLASLEPAIDSKTILVSAHAGPSQLAGELCSPYVYTTGVENDQTAAAMGLYMNQKGVKNTYVLSPNYAAGKDIVAGLKSTFRGKIVGEEYTRWPDQLDFSTELSNISATKPDAVFAFYPGAAGVQFLNQYEQSGLKGKIPLYTVFTIDETTLPLQGANAIGIPGAQDWVNDLPNEANRKYVTDYKSKYKTSPTYYGAESYDAANLINSSVVAVNGDLTRKDDLLKALKMAKFASVRGAFQYGNNHFGIQNFYLQDVVKRADGSLGLETVATIVKDSQDRYHDRCPMP